MCRLLSYLGQPILVEDLLYSPENSLVKQSYSPRFMHNYQNLAGFGMSVWDDSSHMPDQPFFYKTEALPFYDQNLKLLSKKLRANCLLAHVRGVEYSEQQTIVQQNAHPFLFSGCSVALAHNGSLVGINEIKNDLMQYIKPSVVSQIRGSTDSEWIYALIVSQLDLGDNPNPSLDAVKEAVIDALSIIRALRKRHGIAISSPLNLFLSNGEYIVATRFVFDFGCFPVNFSKLHLAYHSMWYTFGEEFGLFNGVYRTQGLEQRNCIVIASEPLGEDTTMWVQVPEYSMVSAWREDNQVWVKTENLDV